MEEEIVENVVSQVDIGEVISGTINSLCSNLLSSIQESIFPLLDKMAFIDESILKSGEYKKIFGTDINSGLLLLANSLIVAFVLYYCVRLLIVHFSGNDVESPMQFLVRCIIVVIVMNSSFFIAEILLKFTSELSSFICSLGSRTLGNEASFQNLSELLCTAKSDFDIFSLEGILSSFLSIGSFALIITFSLRYILIKVLVFASPFAILCLINKSTVGFFRSWYRCLLPLLLLQIFISLVLLISYMLIDDSSSLFNKFLLVGAIYTLLKSNQFMKEFIGGLGIQTSFSAGISGIKSLFAR